MKEKVRSVAPATMAPRTMTMMGRATRGTKGLPWRTISEIMVITVVSRRRALADAREGREGGGCGEDARGGRGGHAAHPNMGTLRNSSAASPVVTMRKKETASGVICGERGGHRCEPVVVRSARPSVRSRPHLPAPCPTHGLEQ